MEPAALERGWRGFARHLLSWLVGFRWIIFLAVCIPLFYAEENYRGKRAWDRYKQEQKNKGRNLDWNLRSQPKVPDAENFYYAPGMAKWSLKGASALPTLNPAGMPNSVRNRLLKVVVEILPFRAGKEPEPANADLMLEYDPPELRFCHSAGEEVAVQPDLPPGQIPLIVMEEVPLFDAIKNLARQAGVNFMVDPGLFFGTGDAEGVPLPQPYVSVRFEDVTAMEALQVILRNYGLLWVPDPKTKVARIVRRDPNQPHVVLGTGVRQRLEELLFASFGPFLHGVQGNPIFARQIDDARPVRLAIRTHAPINTKELAFLTSTQPYGYGEALLKDFVIRETPNHCFLVQLPPKVACFAAEYLDWTSQLEPDFDQIRNALERPYALPPNSTSDPLDVPVESLLSLRLIGQTLAQRAQAQLLLGQPSQALKELTLLHDLCRTLDGPPTNRYMTLTAALFEITLAGLHAGVVADGLRLHAWREAELAVLQGQLEEVNLHQTIARFFGGAPAYMCSALESEIGTQRIQTRLIGSSAQSFFGRFDLLPRGWYYLSLVKLDAVLQSLNDVHDTSRQFVVPHKVESAGNYVQAVANRISPDTLFARGLGPNEVHAYQFTTFTQTTINQAALACALERHRLVRGGYPDSLEALVPEFVGVLPDDIINGRTLQYCRIPDEGYQIYSVGWDEKDDRGIPPVQVGWRNYAASGDWTWRFPVN